MVVFCAAAPLGAEQGKLAESRMPYQHCTHPQWGMQRRCEVGQGPTYYEKGQREEESFVRLSHGTRAPQGLLP